MPFLEQVYMIFLDGLPTVNGSCIRHKNRVLGEKRGHGGGIVVVDCLLILPSNRIKLLDYLWIDRFFHRLFWGGWIDRRSNDLLRDFSGSRNVRGPEGSEGMP
jgi:hypothetical protein